MLRQIQISVEAGRRYFFAVGYGKTRKTMAGTGEKPAAPTTRGSTLTAFSIPKYNQEAKDI